MTSRTGHPAAVGIGFRPIHFAELTETQPVDWLEVHPENYMVDGGPRLAQLDAIRARYPVSLHAVGLSLGSAEPVEVEHLERLARLVDRLEPMLISDHLSWSGIGGIRLPDLLPVPYTAEALDVLVANIGRVQDRLRRRILIENPSRYLAPAVSEMDEATFFGRLSGRSGCGILLDVNNLHVSASNLGGDPADYLAALPAAAVGEIHLAGHKTEVVDGTTVRIDDHGSSVAEPVWALFRLALQRFGPIPSLIEWDTDIPPLTTLVAEAGKAASVICDTGSVANARRHGRAA